MIEAVVVYDRGTHVVVLPKHIEPGTVVKIGPPRNVKAVVERVDLPGEDGENDGLMLCKVMDGDERRPLMHDCFGGWMGLPDDRAFVVIPDTTVREDSDRVRKAAGIDPLPLSARERGLAPPSF